MECQQDFKLVTCDLVITRNQDFSQRETTVVSKQPLLLQLRNAAGFVEDAKRLMPGQDVAKVLEKRPGLVLELQSFDDIIPYDNGSAKQLERTLALRASGEKGGDGVGSPDGW